VLRLFYAIEFLIALVATYTVWSQVGGQGHLDMMAWYWKLFLGVGIAFAAVKATGAAVAGKRTWNARTLRWLSIILALSLACGLVTYYYHLTEPPPGDEEDTAPSSQTALETAPGAS
jgi:hypothetical protein